MSSRDFVRKALEHSVELRSVAEVDIFEGDLTFKRPVCTHFNLRSGLLLLLLVFSFTSNFLFLSLGDCFKNKWLLLRASFESYQLLDGQQVLTDVSASMEKGAESVIHALKLLEEQGQGKGGVGSTEVDTQRARAAEHTVG